MHVAPWGPSRTPTLFVDDFDTTSAAEIIAYADTCGAMIGKRFSVSLDGHSARLYSKKQIAEIFKRRDLGKNLCAFDGKKVLVEVGDKKEARLRIPGRLQNIPFSEALKHGHRRGPVVKILSRTTGLVRTNRLITHRKKIQWTIRVDNIRSIQAI